ELAECQAALADAAECRPSLLAVAGDSGVGKTRLLNAFEETSADGARFLRGASVELGDCELPYAPLSGALRELVRCEDPVLGELSEAARSALGALLPALRDEHTDSGDSESAQLRLFESLLELLRLLGEECPVVLALEDLHWADSSTRAFTAFLSRSLHDERVLFVFTYRADEMHRRHPLLPLLGEIERGAHARRIAIRPWVQEELAEALADILGASAAPELLARLFARGEGNPLYTEELLAAGLDGRGATPQSLHDAFMLRFERLPADAQPAMRALAVARQADERLLADVSGLNAGELTAALRRAVADNMTTANRADRFEYRHELLREAVYEDLLPGERADLHRRLADALEARRNERGAEDPGLAAAVAAHAHAAGDVELTLTASLAAADVAAAIHAHGDAAHLLERAMEVWARVADADGAAGIDHVTLLLRAADEHSLDQQRGRAETLYAHAIAELDRANEPERVADALYRLARTQWNLSRGDDALATAREALSLLPAGPANPRRATLLAWLARTTLLRGRYREAVGAAEEAIAMIDETCAGSDVQSEARNTLAMALVGSGSIDEGIDEMHAALAMAERDGSVGAMESACANLADLLLANGKVAEALSVAEEGLARSRQARTSNPVWLATTVAEIAFALGDWKLAADSLAVEKKVLEGRWLINLRLREAELDLGRGNLEEAARKLAEIEPLVAQSVEPQWYANYGLVSADLHQRRGELDAARGDLEEALDRIEFCTDDSSRITTITAALVAIDAEAAQLASDLCDGDATEIALQRARIMMERARAGHETAGVVGHAWIATSESWLARAESREDPALWATAVESWESVERPYPAARARMREAEAWLEQGDRGKAAERLREARSRASDLGAEWLVAALDAIGARARIAIESPGAPADARPVAENPFELTSREQEVLALLARGATNREIGAELYMAEKTASVHVSRILGKLGVRSRTQAAAVATRAGLLDGGRATSH
ncbi:MAG TPA: AAA family ATPase, partial [Solirubrobacteraceae bacterium]|nr:AAA family ATPase [Solirubrobacteraceae bacterium]